MFDLELAFTKFYQAHRDLPKATREAECLGFLLPKMRVAWREGELLVGRIAYPLVGFSPEPQGYGYYCTENAISERLEKNPPAEDQRKEIEGMLAFWRTENTEVQTRATYPADVLKALPGEEWTPEAGAAFPIYRLAGLTLDYEKLLRIGLSGLSEECRALAEAGAGPEDASRAEFGRACVAAVQLIAESCTWHACEIRSRATDAQALELAGVLERIAQNPPQSFYEAVQLFWIFAIQSGTWNYGRLDDFLGPFLVRDLDAGVLTEARALEILQTLWLLICDYDNKFNNRIMIGGRGRRNEAAADRFALLAIEATRTVLRNQPQLSLRFYTGQNPALFEAAMNCLGEGRTFPILYNDDVNIPAFAKALGVSEKTAENYMPYGCGEYTLYHASIGTPSGLINLLKCLEFALHDGKNPFTGKQLGPKTGAPESFSTFEEFWAAYAKQVEYYVVALAQQQKIEYDVAGEHCAFLLPGLLFDDCLKRGKPLLSGGATHLGGTLETYGNINTADSLSAIKYLVFQERTVSLPELVAACDANYQEHAALRKLALAAPKFGNDNAEADAMAARVHAHVCNAIRDQAAKVGLDSYLAVVINNSANTTFGKLTAASADGRLCAESMANAINPAPGRDISGVTAFLNSLVKMDPTVHAGSVQNMKFSKGLFNRSREKLKALLNTYFLQGGSQAMITVLDRRDLEAAMLEPEKWGHIMVRVGGFSARFIDLPQDVQREVLERTLHE